MVTNKCHRSDALQVHVRVTAAPAYVRFLPIPVTKISRMSMSERRQDGRAQRLVKVALVCLGASLLLLFAMIRNAETIAAFNLTDRIYFVALVPLGVFASMLLFGLLRSSAKYSGRAMGGALRIGGPPVIFIVVEVLGFTYINHQITFPLTVYVHSGLGPQDLVLRNSGEVVIRLGPDSRRKQIAEDGQAYFPAIPASFQGERVNVWVESTEFENVSQESLQLTAPSVDLIVRRKNRTISGRVQTESGDPIANAQVQMFGSATLSVTDAFGHFQISIPESVSGSAFQVEVVAAHYGRVRESLVPNANEAVITLSRVP
jgi:hypothetical protein